MKEKLDASDREALIKYRLDRSLETLAEADYNAKGGYFNTAVNRLYYAAYYAVSALMLKKSLNASTHAGVKSMFSLHFVRTGILDIDCGKTFMRLFECRQSGDYEDFVYCDQHTYSDLKPRTEILIESVKALIYSI